MSEIPVAIKNGGMGGGSGSGTYKYNTDGPTINLSSTPVIFMGFGYSGGLAHMFHYDEEKGINYSVRCNGSFGVYIKQNTIEINGNQVKITPADYAEAFKSTSISYVFA